jgi:asparagine synthase (glutamine-hydrolysing)
MCGIAGLYDGIGHEPFDMGLVKRMADALAHRGPDGEGFYATPGVALAHRRLAVIDLVSGAQPMTSAGQDAVIVFNGEIYNFRELTAELKSLGQVFRTHSDTEVILNAWKAWGPASVRRLCGMFAFALWDVRNETLVLARDHIGEKPLYYSIKDNRKLAFASELKGLLPCPWISREISAEAVEDYLTLGYVPDPKSVYRDILKLPPAHMLVWKKGAAPRLSAYWDLNLTECVQRSFSGTVEELTARLTKAVKQRVVSDVPLGAFLSGGVDSSGVVAHMARSADEPIKTCTIGFGEASHDERLFARAMARRYNTNHVEKVISSDFAVTAPRFLDRVAEAYDEPFADCSAISTYQVCALARENVTVALSGDGGDEAFGGYRRYKWHTREHAVRALLPDSLRTSVFGTLARVYPQLAWAPRYLRGQSTFRELAQTATKAYLNNISVISDPLRESLYHPQFRSDLQGYHASAVIDELMSAAPADNPLLQAQYVDTKTWLAGRMLVKVDRASMAHGLEVRSPFLDPSLFQWALSLPARLKISSGEQKFVLKRSLEPFVSNELLYRPKRGFDVPLSSWIRGPLQPLIERAITAPVLLQAGYFRPDALIALLNDHMSHARDHSAALWSVFMLERFLAREAGLPEEDNALRDVAHDRGANRVGHRERESFP